MAGPAAERAVEDALTCGKALLKFISPNDVGITGSHQCGFYLPKHAWKLFTPNPPTKGENAESWPKIEWQNGQVTESRIIWYGRGTRSEYRLTRFGRDFPYLTEDVVGDLLVLVPKSYDEFSAYVLDLDDDIEHATSTLGVEVLDKWGAIYTAEGRPAETEDECVDRHFREFVATLTDFPSTVAFSSLTQRSLEDCIKAFEGFSLDDRLLNLVRAEYELFRMAERVLCTTQIQRLFKSVDDFLQTASSIMNRRKSRAGRSLENHFEYLLAKTQIPFEIRPDVDGEPDVIMPGRAAYEDSTYPADKLFMVGLKTTCKDRWRQVMNEARRIPEKHILTLQPGISTKQLQQMQQANVTLIVPARLQKEYPPNSGVKLLSVEDFVGRVARQLRQPA